MFLQFLAGWLFARNTTPDVRVNNNRMPSYNIEDGHPMVVANFYGKIGAAFLVRMYDSHVVCMDKKGEQITLHKSEVIEWARYNKQQNGWVPIKANAAKAKPQRR